MARTTTRTPALTRRSAGVPAWVWLEGRRRAGGRYAVGYHDMTSATQQRTRRNAVITAIVMGLAALGAVSLAITTAPDLLVGFAAAYGVAAWLAFCIFRRSRAYRSRAAMQQAVHAAIALARRQVQAPVIVGARRVRASRVASAMTRAASTHRRAVAVRSAQLHGLAHTALVDARLTAQQGAPG